MHLPILLFERSRLHDQALARDSETAAKQPSDKELARRAARLKREWKQDGTAVLHHTSHVTGLRWHEKDINAYLTWGVRSYSSPLTINLMRSPDSLLDILTHELIHRILSDPVNQRRIRKRWDELMAVYGDEPLNTRRHVVIHAIHELVILSVFDNNRLERERAGARLAEYRRAWELVSRDGAERIVAAIRPTRTP